MKYKLGSVVKINTSNNRDFFNNDNIECYKNKVGTIIEIDEHYTYLPYYVLFDKKLKYGRWFRENEIYQDMTCKILFGSSK